MIERTFSYFNYLFCQMAQNPPFFFFNWAFFHSYPPANINPPHQNTRVTQFLQPVSCPFHAAPLCVLLWRWVLGFDSAVRVVDIQPFQPHRKSYLSVPTTLWCHDTDLPPKGMLQMDILLDAREGWEGWEGRVGGLALFPHFVIFCVFSLRLLVRLCQYHPPVSIQYI